MASPSDYEDFDTVADRVPVTILTGFLGAGKTTLFNHILTATHGKKIAVIQNEFGEVGIDDRLMAKQTKFATDEQIVETLNGCVCCSVRKDLIKVLKNLAGRHKAGKLMLDAIVIETTGMANPAPVAQTFLVEPEIRAFARLDGVVTLVDAKHIEQHLDEKKADGAINESVQQVAFADRLLLNKIDLVPSEKALERIEERLRTINPYAPIQRCSKSNVSVDRVLGIHGFDLQRTLARDPSFMDVTRPPTKHDAAVSSHSIDQAAARHLRGVKSGDLDLMRTQEWIGKLLEERGEDIYRMKGVLAIAHAKEKFVFHAVHMLMDGTFEGAWAEGEPRESKLVFIGKNLDPKALNASFNACLDTPELRAERLAALRFGTGDEVECNVGEGQWDRGVVVGLMYRDDSMPSGQMAPYQVRLHADDELIFAPEDSDCVIRRPRRRSGRLADLGTGADDVDECADAHGGGCGEEVTHSHDHAHASSSSSPRSKKHKSSKHAHEHSHSAAGGNEHGHVHDENCDHDEDSDEDDGAQEHSHHSHMH